MSETMFLGDRNTITLARALDHNGERYLPCDELIVDRETAKRLVENGYGTVTSMAWDKGLKMTGPSIDFRRK